MKLRSIRNSAFKPKNKRVLVRVEFNVPIDKNGNILDNRRIVATIPTLKRIMKKKPKQMILMCHIGRPEKDDRSILTTDKVAAEVAKLLGHQVIKVNHCGEKQMPLAPVVMLENLRFYDGEKSGSEVFAKKLANLADYYVNESFGTCHRKNASMYVVPKFFQKNRRFAGLQVAYEVSRLSKSLSPKRPFVSVLGFAKIGDKLPLLEALLKKSDKVLIGGAVAFNFLRAEGCTTGNSLIDPDSIHTAKELLETYRNKIVLPSDIRGIIGKKPQKAPVKTVPSTRIPNNFIGLDIGPQTVKDFLIEIKKARLVFWNGPTGMFELPPFGASTQAIATFLQKKHIKAIVGGGDTVRAVSKFAPKVYHISTGGGAALEFIAYGDLPALHWLR